MTDQPKRPRRIRALPPPAVDTAPMAELPQIAAIKALAAGMASEHQQRLAWDFILRSAGAIQAQSFRSNDALSTAFMEGRRFVASTLLTIANIDTTTMKDDDR